MEAVRLAFPMQLSTFADLPGRRVIIVVLLIEGLLAHLPAVLPDGLVQLFQIRFGRSLDRHRCLFVLGSFGLDVGRIRIYAMRISLKWSHQQQNIRTVLLPKNRR